MLCVALEAGVEDIEVSVLVAALVLAEIATVEVEVATGELF
jgi:hypothetical protein